MLVCFVQSSCPFLPCLDIELEASLAGRVLLLQHIVGLSSCYTLLMLPAHFSFCSHCSVAPIGRMRRTQSILCSFKVLCVSRSLALRLTYTNSRPLTVLYPHSRHNYQAVTLHVWYPTEILNANSQRWK